jgi:Cysteine-rich secretory protein family
MKAPGMLHVAIVASFLSAAATARPIQPLGADSFTARMLAAHNAQRMANGIGPLIWDPTLASGAAAQAQQMAITGRLAHSDRRARRGVGENLWMGTHGLAGPEAMVGLWAGEKRNFVPGTFPAVSRTGNWMDVAHYTQVIWPTTQRVGCAIAIGHRVDYLVCRYWPAGNIDGHRVP